MRRARRSRAAGSTRQIENAQRKVEATTSISARQLLEYDDVANDQRKVVYQQRDDLMDATTSPMTIANLRYDMVNAVIDTYPAAEPRGAVGRAGLTEALKENFDLDAPIQQWLDRRTSCTRNRSGRRSSTKIVKRYEAKERQAGAEQMRRIEKEVMLFTLDSHWKEHLAAMDYLRQGIHLRGYAQKNPKQEYKREAFERSRRCSTQIKLEVVQVLSRLQLQMPRMCRQAMPTGTPDPNEFEFKHEAFEGLGGEGVAEPPPPEQPVIGEKKPFVRPDRKIGRNDPCPCGSGKKYKHCHGRIG
jgi:preprotein translocase subunit SecA